MSRIAFDQAAVRRRHLRREYVPIVSTIIACLFSLLPIIVSSPLVPDMGFLVLIAWRLLRPEMWGPAIALPLGLFSDLVGGHPPGQSMAIWTMLFIAFDVADIHAEIARLRDEGFVVLNETPKRGADNKLVAFLHPKGTHGVLVELCQEAPGD